MTLVEFESSIRENTNIHTLRNLRIERPFHHIPFDPVKSAMVIFLNELLYKTMHDDYVNDRLFVFLRDAMILLDDSLEARNFHLWCLLEISRHYGFYPQPLQGEANTYFDLNTGEFAVHRPIHANYIAGDNAQTLLFLLDREWPEVQPAQMHNTIRKELLGTLVNYIRLHLENQREIKSLQVLHEVFHD